jgi:cobalt-zinc-cadmium efflux system protein
MDKEQESDRHPGHEHGHSHAHEPPASLGNLIYAIVINGGIVAFELFFGLLIQSTALISDAVHNLSDIASLVTTYWAEKVALRPANERKTYGYRKIEFISALAHSIVLSVIMAFIFWEALQRLAAPPPIPGREMLWVSLIAFVGNGAATLLLQKLSARNFNLRGAWLHSLQDALFSLAVIVGALLIILFDWRIVDPLLSITICLFIARAIWRIIRRSVDSLLDAVPPGIDFGKVRADLRAIPDVAAVNDLHIWEMGTGRLLLSVHLVSRGETAGHEAIVRAVQEILSERYGIRHTTIQVLPASALAMPHCDHCNWGEGDAKP